MFSSNLSAVVQNLERVHAFPAHWNPSWGRVGDGGGDIHSWFKSSVNRAGGDLNQCKIEENLAAFIALRCDGNIIRYASMQLLVTTDATLEDFYERKGKGKHHYFRLDYEPEHRLEEMFRTPLAHIHVNPLGAPRISLSGMGTGNVVIDFFDFLYRNYFYNQWRSWAKDVWDKDVKRRMIRPDKDPWFTIEAAFRHNKLDQLRRFSTEIGWMKQAFRATKDAAFNLRIPQGDHDLVSC